MIYDLLTNVIADIGNLLTHVNIFNRNVNHSHSCLLCSSTEITSPIVQLNLYPIRTSTDLDLLKTENNKTRCVVIKNQENNLTFYLNHYLFFETKDIQHFIHLDNLQFITFIVQDNDMYCLIYQALQMNIRMIVICDVNFYETYNSLLEKIPCIIYYDYDYTIQSLVHGLFVTKSKMRLQDVNTFLKEEYGYLHVPNDCNLQTCLFL